MNKRPTDPSDLIFSSAYTNINSVVTELQRDKLSIRNRITSIIKDAAFVENAQRELQLPFIANERCGSWYIRPEMKGGSAYFKSTDGHFGQWSFSLRRLNLHLLEIIEESNGCIIVDSTRRGKSMPDALSKTVPIWITILNRYLFPEHSASHSLSTPSNVVSGSEHAQIESRLDEFLMNLQNLQLHVDELREKLKKPLKAYWLTPDIDLSIVETPSDRFHPVFLCTASSRVSADIAGDATYVQGAADDHESWALGLNAVNFWQNEKQLAAANEDELPELISKLTEKSTSISHRSPSLIRPTSDLFICDNSSVLEQLHAAQTIIICTQDLDPAIEKGALNAKVKLIHLICGEGKVGSRQLRNELGKIDNVEVNVSVLCSCPSGRDLAVGVALAMLCKYFSIDGHRQPSSSAFNKTEIKQRLSWIMVSMPDASPSRATLQSVNAYLMS